MIFLLKRKQLTIPGERQAVFKAAFMEKSRRLIQHFANLKTYNHKLQTFKSRFVADNRGRIEKFNTRVP
jgi:hypothetical protein